MSERRGWVPPTMRDCYQSAVNNAMESERHLTAARQRIRYIMPGDNTLPDAKASAQQAIAEVAHWRNYAEYFLQRCEAEGDLTVPGTRGQNDFLAALAEKVPF